MAQVTCPECGRQYRMSQPPPEGAKLKCSHCGQTFAYQPSRIDRAMRPEDELTSAVDEFRRESGPGAARPVASLRGRNWMIPLVLGLALLAGGLVVFAVHAISNPKVKVVGDAGEQDLGRMNRDEAEQLAERERQRERDAAVRHRRAEGMYRRNRPGASADGASGPDPSAPPAGDEKLTVTGRVEEGSLPNTGVVLGHVLNRYQEGVTDIAVHARLVNPAGEIKDLPPFTIDNVAPGQSAPFSIAFDQTPEVSTLQVHTWAEGVNRDDPSIVAWEIAPGQVYVDQVRPDGSSVWSGAVTNPLGARAVRDVTVHLDFYDIDGRHLASATGSLRDDDRLAGGASGVFDAVLAFEGLVTAEQVAEVVARAVAVR